MGTRADFYVGRVGGEWLGSIAHDGRPDNVQAAIGKSAETEDTWRASIAKCFGKRQSFTLPEQGWPWPWKNSRTTDYGYAWENGVVYVSCFGHEWFLLAEGEPGDSCEGDKVAVFPDMSARQIVTLGPRSGVIALGKKCEETTHGE